MFQTFNIFSIKIDKFILTTVIAFLHLCFNSEAKFMLSCKVISGICQEDGMCLNEMSSRFPDCYLDAVKRFDNNNNNQYVKPLITPTQNSIYRNDRPSNFFAFDNNKFNKQLPSIEYEKLYESNIDYELNDKIPVKNKRAMKLRNILMKVDRIPVG